MLVRTDESDSNCVIVNFNAICTEFPGKSMAMTLTDEMVSTEEPTIPFGKE